MKITFDNLKKFLKYRKEDIERCKEDCKNWKNGDVYKKLFNEKSIKKCKEIIKENFEEGTRQNSVVESYFCTPYLISIWNDNEDKKNIKYSEEISDEIEEISIDKLYIALKNNKKTYLKLYGISFFNLEMEKIVELEI